MASPLPHGEVGWPTRHLEGATRCTHVSAEGVEGRREWREGVEGGSRRKDGVEGGSGRKEGGTGGSGGRDWKEGQSGRREWKEEVEGGREGVEGEKGRREGVEGGRGRETVVHPIRYSYRTCQYAIPGISRVHVGAPHELKEATNAQSSDTALSQSL